MNVHKPSFTEDNLIYMLYNKSKKVYEEHYINFSKERERERERERFLEILLFLNFIPKNFY